MGMIRDAQGSGWLTQSEHELWHTGSPGDQLMMILVAMHHSTPSRWPVSAIIASCQKTKTMEQTSNAVVAMPTWLMLELSGFRFLQRLSRSRDCCAPCSGEVSLKEDTTLVRIFQRHLQPCVSALALFQALAPRLQSRCRSPRGRWQRLRTQSP